MNNLKPILLDKLESISTILSENYKNNEHVGVLSGISGIALFQFYYSKFTEKESHADVGVEIISSVIERINEGYSFPTFCTGIAGAGWAIELLDEEGFIDIDSDDLLSDLDDYLSRAIVQMGEKDKFYDFLHGAIGIGFYFFKRYQSTKSLDLKKSYKVKLLEIVASLKRASIEENGMMKWESYLSEEDEIKGFNLSLSHGMASIINFLSRLTVYDDFRDVVLPILEKATQFILSNENKDVSCSSFFPSWIYEGKEKNNERLAWCYGDLGIGLTLWRVGNVLGNDMIAQKGLITVENSCKRRDLIETKVKDNGLCHGTFGMVQIYNHMYNETQKAIFKETADYWMEQGLNMAIHEDGYVGYKQWSGGTDEGWRKEMNLLEGVAGIGLSIISYLAPFETKWDECLLIS
ncbi:Lanthionine synthetase C-like protein [Aquimarina amphilecti]|uniref:Lanthionine synthetase C-like protein n=1 Tax=Aquimarina amphilecti TaxID=1038014 RepID=A0A1H7J4B9_AQUAM|nr:lanthionine synthetase C family protein [Aquimarina amphilecti]SEK69613.1 Lanthionine synthetase C-like protein [Aquimarina amphilecti]